MWKILLIFCAIFFKTSVNLVFGQFDNCDYYQMLKFGDIYIVLSNNYPGFYRPSTNCRYAVVAPYGHKIELFCNEFDLPNVCIKTQTDVTMNNYIGLLWMKL